MTSAPRQLAARALPALHLNFRFDARAHVCARCARADSRNEQKRRINTLRLPIMPWLWPSPKLVEGVACTHTCSNSARPAPFVSGAPLRLDSGTFLVEEVRSYCREIYHSFTGLHVDMVAKFAELEDALDDEA